MIDDNKNKNKLKMIDVYENKNLFDMRIVITETIK
jgi:hypothetical protein